MRNAAKLMAAAGTAVGALAVLAGIHDGVVDAAADAVVVLSLLSLSHTVFRLVDDAEPPPPGGKGENTPPGRRGARRG